MSTDPFTYTLQEFRRQGVRHTISQVIHISGDWPEGLVEFIANLDTPIVFPDGQRIRDVFSMPMPGVDTLDQAFNEVDAFAEDSKPQIMERVLADMKAAGPKPQIATAPASLLDSLEYKPQTKRRRRRNA